MKPFYAPLYEALARHARSRPASFHVPGHHNGNVLRRAAAMNPELRETLTEFASVMRLDVTELSSTDDLHHPEGPILEAQRLAAAFFGAEQTFMLAGGSTAGNLAMILTVCEPGDLLIVQRNVHKSVLNGLMLAGASAVFVSPEREETTGLATVPALDHIDAALRLYPEAKAVLLTNPNYYGMAVPLNRYADLAHRYGKPLLVDEAHGAHFSLHPELPRSALAAGADAVVQSTHKTLPALTMGAMLHVQGRRIDRNVLAQSLAVIQSSSPSFPIIASLDLSRAIMETFGLQLLEDGMAKAKEVRRWINGQELGTIRAVAPEQLTHSAGEREAEVQFDPFRLLLYSTDDQITGFKLQRELEAHGCWIEMSDPRYAVLVLGIYTPDDELNKLKNALLSIDLHLKELPTGIERQTAASLSYQSEQEEALTAVGLPVSFARGGLKGKTTARVGQHDAEGLQAAEMVVPYPPGIPIVYRGETLTKAIIGHIERLAAAGAKFQGAEDSRMNTIAVFRDESVPAEHHKGTD